MAIVIFKVNIKKINTDVVSYAQNKDPGRFIVDEREVFSFETSTNNINQKDIEGLIGRLGEIIGDGYSINYNYSANELFTRFYLIDYYKDAEERLVDDIINECNKFFNERVQVNNIDKDNFEDELFEEDGILLCFENQPECDLIVSKEEIEEVLKENAISSKVMNVSGSKIECGCSGSSDAFIIFLWSTIASGVTWDTIKNLIAFKFRMELSRIGACFLENIQYKRIRRIVADRIQEEPKNLSLVWFMKDIGTDSIYMRLKCRKRLINLECSKNYNIIKLEVL